MKPMGLFTVIPLGLGLFFLGMGLLTVNPIFMGLGLFLLAAGVGLRRLIKKVNSRKNRRS
ncbi:MAG: hypothetical protein ACI9OJ_002117 [Myxococcota bacterium]|jgi:hypothetical protein